MKKIKFSHHFIVLLAAVTLVAAVVVPKFGIRLLYADTNAAILEQEIHAESETEDAKEEENTLIQNERETVEASDGEQSNEERSNEGLLNEERSNEGQSNEGQSNEEQSNEEQSNEEQSNEEQLNEGLSSEEQINEGLSNEEQSNEERLNEERSNEEKEIPEVTQETAGDLSESDLSPKETPPQNEEAAFDETLEQDTEKAPEVMEDPVIIEEAEEEATFADHSENVSKGEALAGAKKGEAPVSGTICRIRLLKNGDTASGSEDGYVITLPESNKEKQKFFAEKIGKNWRFVNTVTGKALVVTEPDGNGGRFVALEEPTGGKRELWRLIPYGNGYGLQSLIDGRVLTSSLSGNGNYTILTDGKGVTRQTWTFTTCQESIRNAEITVEANVGKNAKSLLPETEVRIGGRLLKKDVDYLLTGGTEAGKAKAVIQGIGNFAGKTTRSYEIIDSAGEIVSGGFYMLVPKQNTTWTMGTMEGGMINGTNIVAQKKNGAEHQIFQIVKNEDSYVFTNVKSSKAIAPDGKSKGADISLFASGKEESKIKAVLRPNGAFVLRTVHRRYIKTLNGKMTAANKKITASAYYYLVPVNGPSMTFQDIYYIRTLSRIRLVAGISGASKANGAQAVLSNYADASSQRFEFLYSGNGYYRIVNMKSRKVLTASAEGSVVQKSWTGDAGQRWKPVTKASGYLLKNAAGSVLTVSGDYIKNGRALGAAGEDGSTKQFFLLLARGSGEAKKNLVRKPLTIYKGTDYAAVYNYDDYMDRYNNLASIYGTDCTGALQYFVENGMREGQHGSNSFDVWCYRRSNPAVRKELLADIPAYYLHYIRIGKAQGLKASGSYQTTQAASLQDLAWKCYNEWGAFSNRPYSQQMCEILSAAAEVQYQAYGFPKSIVIAMAIKECGFLTFNGGLPPTSNNVLTMNVDMWNGKWKSGWLGGYASVKVPQYNSATGQLVYGYENVRCYEDIEACMDDFANFKTTLLGPVPYGMSIEAVIDKYLEGYATSPGYKKSILNTIKLHQLTRFDH